MAVPQNPEGKDRRKNPRADAAFSVVYKVKSPFEVILEVGRNEFDSIAEDIAIGGIAVISNEVIPPKTIVGLSFKMFNEKATIKADGYRSFELTAETRYLVPWSKEGSRIGLQFMDATPEDVRFIAAYILDNALREDKDFKIT